MHKAWAFPAHPGCCLELLLALCVRQVHLPEPHSYLSNGGSRLAFPVLVGTEGGAGHAGVTPCGVLGY